MADVLIVSSKVRKFISEKSEFNTSAEFLTALSEQVEKVCLAAIEQAKAGKRKTVKARDII